MPNRNENLDSPLVTRLVENARCRRREEGAALQAEKATAWAGVVSRIFEPETPSSRSWTDPAQIRCILEEFKGADVGMLLGEVVGSYVFDDLSVDGAGQRLTSGALKPLGQVRRVDFSWFGRREALWSCFRLHVRSGEEAAFLLVAKGGPLFGTEFADDSLARYETASLSTAIEAAIEELSRGGDTLS